MIVQAFIRALNIASFQKPNYPEVVQFITEEGIVYEPGEVQPVEAGVIVVKLLEVDGD